MTALSLPDLAEWVARDPDAFIDERDRRRLRHFNHRLMPGYIDGVHIDRLTDALEAVERGGITRLIVTMPPRHSKSLNVSEHFPAWYLGKHPDQRIIAASHTAQLAYTFSRRVRNKLTDPRYPFPVTIADDKGAVQAWDTSEGGGYIAVGAGGSPTGHGANGILIDDPIRSAADADSETVRESLWEWYTGTMRTRLQPGGWIVLTATRWHMDDLTGRLLAAMKTGGESWHHLHMPAVDDDTGDPLWPEFWPLDALDGIRQSVGSRVWEAQYQGRPTPAEGGMFKRHWWQRYRVLPHIKRAELVVDSAFKEGVENDYSAFALWGTDGAGSAYLVRVWRARIAFPELIQLGHDAHAWARQQFPHLKIPLVVEDKASGQSAIQTWRQPTYTKAGMLPALPVIPFAIKGNQSKIARAEGVTPVAEGGRAFVPEAAPWLDDWLTEHEAFPTGAHDDMVDTTSMALTRFDLLGRGAKARSF